MKCRVLRQHAFLEPDLREGTHVDDDPCRISSVLVQRQWNSPTLFRDQATSSTVSFRASSSENAMSGMGLKPDVASKAALQKRAPAIMKNVFRVRSI
jgi:hypothetical protein